MAGSQFKCCPRCTAVAPVDATLCQECGHAFRMHVTPPPTAAVQPLPDQVRKICPRCKWPASLEAASCEICGRAYRAQFVPPAEPPAIVAPLLPRPRLQVRLQAAAATWAARMGRQDPRRVALNVAPIVAILLLTNPDQADLAAFLAHRAQQEQQAEQTAHSPREEPETAGDAFAAAIAPHMVNAYLRRYNCLLFSVYTRRGGGNAFLVGAGGQFVRVPLPGAGRIRPATEEEARELQARYPHARPSYGSSR